MIYTIKIDSPAESSKLSNFLKKLTHIQVSITENETLVDEASVKSLDITDEQKEILDSRRKRATKENFISVADANRKIKEKYEF